MDNLSLRFVYDRRNEIAKGKSAAPLHIEVRQNKTINRVFINTYIKLKPSEYSEPKIYHGGKSFNLFKRINSIIAASTPKGDKVAVMYSL